MFSGLSRTPTGRSWIGLMGRCFRPSHTAFKHYGARGITVCSFIAASPWSIVGLIGHRPANKTLDRINNDMHYSCGKCQQCRDNGWTMNIRWATKSEQCNNRRTSHRLEINGEIKTVEQWSRFSGVSSKRIHARIKRGWTGEKLIMPPLPPCTHLPCSLSATSVVEKTRN